MQNQMRKWTLEENDIFWLINKGNPEIQKEVIFPIRNQSESIWRWDGWNQAVLGQKLRFCLSFVPYHFIWYHILHSLVQNCINLIKSWRHRKCFLVLSPKKCYSLPSFIYASDFALWLQFCLCFFIEHFVQNSRSLIETWRQKTCFQHCLCL